MGFEEIKERDSHYVANTYARFQVAIESGNGCEFIDVNGKKYIDFSSGIGVNVFGANDEGWKNAVIAQLNKVQHACNLYYTTPQTELAEMLCKRTGAKKVFFSNSGAEANECAIKVARKYNSDRYGENERYEILVLKNSFHGRTMATLSATAQDVFHKNFAPFLDGFPAMEANYESFLSSVTKKTGAVMMELIQGESGVHVLDKEFVQKIYEYCHQNDILFMVDEVQTGNGRTGRLYAYEEFGVVPDVVTTAKGLGGGLPIGACMLFEKTEKVLTFGDHGSTFGGNPVACAGACHVISRLDEEFLSSVREKGERIREELATYSSVESVSGLGLMIGIRVKGKTAKEVALACLERGLFVLTAHEKVRLLPPLSVTDEEIKDGLNILKEVLDV